MSVIQGLVSDNITLDKLLKMNPEEIGRHMKRIDAHQTQTNTLNKALGKLKAWTESQMGGKCQAHSQILKSIW